MGSEEREKVYVLLQSGSTQQAIALALGRSPSTISREIKRNRSLLCHTMNNNHAAKKLKESYHYLPDRAQTKKEKRRKEANQRCPLKTITLFKYVHEELKRGLTPELIAGRARLEGKGEISHECIYQYIYSFVARQKQLWDFLPRRHRKRKKRSGRTLYRGAIQNKVDISLRPKEVETRKTFGHWEGDTVVGKGKRSAVNTNRERLSRYVFFTKIPKKTAEATYSAKKKRFLPLPLKARKSVTEDNGSEFAYHEKFTRTTGTKVFFARPYHAWERGTNENGNGLLRRFFPKKTDFDEVTPQQLKKVEDWVNHRPMKCLNYHSPYEIFHRFLPATQPFLKIALAN